MKTKIEIETLSTIARDNFGHERAVKLIYEGRGAPTLSIEGTPGKWLLTTLRSARGQRTMSLDFGSGWTCTNFDEVLEVALAAHDARRQLRRSGSRS